MTEKEQAKLLEDVIAAIGVIKAQFGVEVIRDYETLPLVNVNTLQSLGFGVKLQLNIRYGYDEAMLTEWKKLLNADSWYISVKRNQLFVSFYARYKKTT